MIREACAQRQQDVERLSGGLGEQDVVLLDPVEVDWTGESPGDPLAYAGAVARPGQIPCHGWALRRIDVEAGVETAVAVRVDKPDNEMGRPRPLDLRCRIRLRWLPT